MKKILMGVSFLVLALMLVSALLCAGNRISADLNRLFLLIGTVAWFVVTPFWMKREG